MGGAPTAAPSRRDLRCLHKPNLQPVGAEYLRRFLRRYPVGAIWFGQQTSGAL